MLVKHLVIELDNNEQNSLSLIGALDKQNNVKDKQKLKHVQHQATTSVQEY